MNFKLGLIALSLLMILTGSWKICGAEELTLKGIPVEIDLPSLKRIDECIQKEPILNDLVKEQGATILKLQEALADKEKLLDLEKRENALNLRIIEIQKREIEGINKNFDQMKEVADRAIKLAEVGKPKSNFQLLGLAGLAVFLAGMIIGK